MRKFFVYDPDSDSVVEKKAERIHTPGKWPIASDSVGVHPSQIDEVKRVDKMIGAPRTEYTSDGRPIFESQSHQNQYLKARGWKNRARYS